MNRLLLSFSLLISLNSFGEINPSLQTLLESSSKIKCKTAGQLSSRSAVILDLSSKTLSVPKFNLNDDPRNHFGVGDGAFSEFTESFKITEELIESKGECSGRPDGHGFIYVNEKYVIRPIANSLKNNKFKATVEYIPCLYKGFNSKGWHPIYELDYKLNSHPYDPSSYAKVNMKCQFLDG